MKLTVTAALAFISNIAIAQTISKTDSSIHHYITKYKDIAIQEQIRTGIPAAIKLAQGIHETNFGNSELCRNANNHFGIKCKSNWTGPSYKYTDDAKDECFRMYESDLASYKDHSNFLMQNQRYAKLFTYDVTDYKSWAHGLKSSGYATNPKYAVLIINLIEKYDLNKFTLLASNTTNLPNTNAIAITTGNISNNNSPSNYNYSTAAKQNTSTQSKEVVETKTLVEPASNKQVVNNFQDNPSINVPFYTPTTLNGIKGFYGKKGDMLLDYATKINIRYNKLLQINSLPDAPLEADMFIYTEKKLKKGLQEKYTVLAGETLIQISQKTGVELQQIKLLNKLVEGVEIKSGEIINLQFEREFSPEIYIPQNKETIKSNSQNNKKSDDYIVVDKKTNNISEDNNTAHYSFPNASKATSNKDDKGRSTTQSNQRYSNQEAIITSPNVVEKVEAPKVSSEQVANDNPNKNTTTPKNYDNLTPYEKLKLHMEKQSTNQEEFKGPSTASSNNNIEAVRPQQTNNTITNNNTTSNNRPSATSNARTHKVKKGETLFSIAQKYNVTVKQLQDWNNVTPKTLTVGRTLKVSK